MNRSHCVVPTDLTRVPPFPPVAARLLRLLSNPDVEVAEVAEVISNDVKLTARLLQFVNSPLFGIGRPVGNVSQAIALIGFDRTRQIAAMNATAAYAKGAANTKELQSCWRHSVTTAILAEDIAKSCEVFTKAAFTVGLLHDIGRLGLILAYPRRLRTSCPRRHSGLCRSSRLRTGGAGDGSCGGRAALSGGLGIAGRVPCHRGPAS